MFNDLPDERIADCINRVGTLEIWLSRMICKRFREIILGDIIQQNKYKVDQLLGIMLSIGCLIGLKILYNQRLITKLIRENNKYHISGSSCEIMRWALSIGIKFDEIDFMNAAKNSITDAYIYARTRCN